MKQLVVSFFICASAHAQLPPLEESTRSDIEYGSVAEALDALRTRPNVDFSIQRDWMIVRDSIHHVLWSFAPKGHAAYPAVVKRQVVHENGMVSLKTGVICEGPKAACDALVREFIDMNKNARP